MCDEDANVLGQIVLGWEQRHCCYGGSPCGEDANLSRSLVWETPRDRVVGVGRRMVVQNGSGPEMSRRQIVSVPSLSHQPAGQHLQQLVVQMSHPRHPNHPELLCCP